MAVTQNTYTGNGSTVLYSFSFPYIETTDIKVSLDGVVTTAYTLANATTVQFNTAPANGVAIRIYRDTDDENAKATFVPGAAIRAQDLNDNFDQILFSSQESSNDASSAVTTANTALSNSATALSNSTTALSTANTADANATAAVSTANTASANASAAVTTANTASSNASAAVTTANAAAADVATAVSAANAATTAATTATTTANTAAANASTALSTANTALSTANTASTNASNAVTSANAAVSTANTADANATAALNALAGSLQYNLVANVASIPSTPVDQYAIEVVDSTGLESFSPVANRPAHFVGDLGLSARLQYSSSGSTWNWLNYFSNDPEIRYLKLSGGTLTGAITLSADPTQNLEAATKQYVDAAISSNPSVIMTDGGNFDNGTSSISTSLTLDGGQF